MKRVLMHNGYKQKSRKNYSQENSIHRLKDNTLILTEDKPNLIIANTKTQILDKT